jgi:2'-5' RNA ligase
MIRVFVAFPLRNDLANFYLETGRRNRIQGVRWTPEDNLHITLFFIGEILEENLEKVKNSLAEIFLNQNSFSLNFESVTFAGKKKSMIWGKFSENPEFKLLSEKIFSGVKEFMTIEMIHSDPVPHCTIARINKGTDLSLVDLNVAKTEQKTVEINLAELWQTVQTREGVRYKCLEKYFLI